MEAKRCAHEELVGLTLADQKLRERPRKVPSLLAGQANQMRGRTLLLGARLGWRRRRGWGKGKGSQEISRWVMLSVHLRGRIGKKEEGGGSYSVLDEAIGCTGPILLSMK